MFGFLRKIFGTQQSRKLKSYAHLVKLVNTWEKKLQTLSDEELKDKTKEYKQRYQNGEKLEDLLPEAYALVKNACRRLCGQEIHIFGYKQKWDMIPYDVQILGAIAMFYGSIAEMHTGEGKTLTAAMPLFIHALSGKATHLVTVNDYLAKRDSEWIGNIFHKLGLQVASLTNDTPPLKRKQIYEADIVYGTASEFGFDYLRDNSMAMEKEQQVQRGHFFAIVDEIDSILIDEARTPLIISGPSAVSRQMYDTLKDEVAQVVQAQKDLCQKTALQAKKIIESLDKPPTSLSKEEKKELSHAYQLLWLVSKGTPHNKILKKYRENPDMRAEVEKWETYYHSQQNKEERASKLSSLFIILDERASEYELTDKGIQFWGEKSGHNGVHDDFLMLDLGYEYAKIDETPSFSTQEKIAKKMSLREEDSKRKERAHNLRQLFRAHLLMEKDVDYIVQNQKIVIIDENTGRAQPGRRFSDGLHQAIEAKESLTIQGETQTYATITLQNYFRLYEKLAGMTGTAMTEANEFKELYKLDVIEIPTYKPSARKDYNDEIYMSEREKYSAILQEIKEIHGKKRPILIGTESVEVSEKLARILKQNRLPYTVLNAKNHTLEAEIIAKAGEKEAITIATNMAGRGTDIKLQDGVSSLGGLHVIGTTRHHARRIDRQLRGRSGRLGDPGSSKFFISFEDSLMRLFASPRMSALLQRFRPPEGEAISAKVLNKSIETAQKRVEQRNYSMRKHTLEYDDVMNKHRQEVYAFRHEILESEDTLQVAKEFLESVCYELTEEFTDRSHIDIEGYTQRIMHQFPVTIQPNALQNSKEIDEAAKYCFSKIFAAFCEKLEYQKFFLQTQRPEIESKEHAEKIVQEIIRNIILRTIDFLWQEHLLNIDHLRDDVQLRSIGQKDPLIEFKHDAFLLFDTFSRKLKLEISTDLFRFTLAPKEPEVPPPSAEKIQLHTHKAFAPSPSEKEQEPPIEKAQPLVVDPKVKRNEECPCGSGKKYKKCCQTKNV